MPTVPTPQMITISFWPEDWVTEMPISASSFSLYPLAASYHSTPQPNPSYERDIWSVAQAEGYLLTSGSTLPSSLRLHVLYTDKRCGSLIWLVFL